MTDVISVVGGGWSMGQVNHDRVPGLVIAINDAAIRLKCDVDAILTMDRLWTEYRWPYLLRAKKPFFCRQTCLQNVPGWRDQPWVHVFDNDNKTAIMSNDAKVLNGSNSGTCGINLAFIHRPKELYLFGFDMQKGPKGEPYWWPPYPWAPQGATKSGKYQDWAREFDIIAGQFKLIGTQVYNVSNRSLIKSFIKLDPVKFNQTKLNVGVAS